MEQYAEIIGMSQNCCNNKKTPKKPIYIKIAKA